MGLLKEDNGKTSSKRVIGFAVIVIALLMAVADQFFGFTVNEAVWITMFSGGMAIIGITVIPRRKPKNDLEG